MTILLVSFYSCNQEEESLSALQGSVSFGGISLEFEPIGSPGSRITENSTWIHVFPNSAILVFTNKVTRERYDLKYNPNDLSTPASISLPFGNYEYYSLVEGGAYSAYLPFEARGEFLLKSKNLEIKLKADTNHGLVTVKNQMVENASISDGKKDAELVADEGSKYWFIYAKKGTASILKVKESLNGSTINRDLDIASNQHYNFKLEVNEGSVKSLDLIMALFDQEGVLESSPKFFEENGTIKCPCAIPGEKGMVSNHTYEAVDRALLIKRRDQGVELRRLCTSLVTDMSRMFASTSFNEPIGNWDVSKVTDMSYMFSRAFFFNQPIGNWDVSHVTNMNRMFSQAIRFNQPIGNWDVCNVTNMVSMFEETRSFNQPIGSWDVGHVTDMSYMFYQATNFNQPIGNWDVSKVTNMYQMFENAQNFNQPIGNWDVSNVTIMVLMFYNASLFNQNLSQWCVQNIPNEPELFSTESALENSNKPVWGTCPD